MKILDYEELSEIINVAIATSKIRSLRTPYKEIRSFMHILLHGRIGGGKSTILWEIANRLNKLPSMNLTRATLIGTVDKHTGELIPPAIWDARESALLIDELSVGKDSSERNMLRLLLMLLENAVINKRMGYRCNDFFEGNKKDLFCEVKKSVITCKTRFIFFGNTMMNLNTTQMHEILALKTRCIVIPYFPSLNDLKRKARGEPFYIYKHYKIKKVDVKINKKDFNKILDFVESFGVGSEYYLRTIGNLCRVFAVVGFKKDLFKNICELVTNK